MSKILAALCMLLFVCGAKPAIAQQTSFEDSLLAVIKTHEDDTAKVSLYVAAYYNNDSFDCGDNKDNDKRLKYATDMLMLAERLKYKKGMAEAYNMIGCVYMHMNGGKNANRALYNFYNSINIFKEIGDKHGWGGALCNTGMVYATWHKHEKAKENLYAAMKLLEEIDTSTYLGITMDAIGYELVTEKEYDKALQCCLAAHAIYERYNYKRGLTTSYAEAAKISSRQGQYDVALSYAAQALGIAQQMSCASIIKSVKRVQAGIQRQKVKSQK